MSEQPVQQQEAQPSPSEAESAVSQDVAQTQSTEPKQDGQATPEIPTLTIFVRTPHGSKLSLQMTPLDNVQDIRQYLFESVDTCHITCYNLFLNGNKINDFQELGQVKGLKSEVTLDMVEGTYDEKSARFHVRRLRDLLQVAVNPGPGYFSSFSPEELMDPAQAKQKKEKEQKEAQEQKPNGTASNDTAKTDELAMDTLEAPSASLSEYFSEVGKVASPVCLRSLTYSGWNPPPGNRRLLGDLFYLEATTLEGKTFYISATTTGFFQNATASPSAFNGSAKSSKTHTLAGLLSQLSPSFRKNFATLVANVFEKQPFQMLPIPIRVNSWVAQPVKHTYDPNRAEDTLAGPVDERGLRDWNEEYQSCRELPHSTVQERIMRDRNFVRINNDFVDAATKAAIAVVHKQVPPINPLEPEKSHMFLYNNIFLSYAVDSREIYKEIGGDQAAHVIANNDLRGIIAYNSADISGLYTLGTAIIDYRGHRVVAQTIIPGILHREETSKVAYGGSLDGSKAINSDSEFHKLMVAAGKQLGIEEHTILDPENNPVPLCAAVESKGIVGTDGRRYVLDLVRATPRDANFPEKATALLRLELVVAFMYYTAKENRANTKKAEQAPAEGEKPESTEEKTEEQKAEEEKKKMDAEVAAEAAELEKVKLNPNVLTEHKLGGTPEVVAQSEAALRKASSFLKETIIPLIVDDFTSYVSVPVDGQTLTTTLHSRGVNIRYLGHLANLVAPYPFIFNICVQEMIARSAKHVFNGLLREVADAELGSTISHFLNCFFGNVLDKHAQQQGQSQSAAASPPSAPAAPSAAATEKSAKKKKKSGKRKLWTTRVLWEAITTTIKEKFAFDLDENAKKKQSKLALLRSFSQKVGLQLYTKDYDFTKELPFAVDDVSDLQPVVKHINPKSIDGYDLMEAGRAFIGQGRLDIALELLFEALAIFHQVYGPMHKDTATCYAHLAMVMFHADDKAQALSHQQKAVLINERVSGRDHHDTVHSYSNVAMFLHSVGRTNDAITYIRRALYLSTIISGPDHPENAAAYTNMASMLQDLGHHKESLQYLAQALKCNEAVFGPNHPQTAAVCHQIAIAYSLMECFRDALAYEKRNYNILHNTVGDQDIRTVESNIWLKQFTAKAVQMQIEAKKTQRDITSQLSQERLQQAKLAGKQLASGALPSLSAHKKGDQVLKFISGGKNVARTLMPKKATVVEAAPVPALEPETQSPPVEGSKPGKKKSKKKSNK